MPSARYGSLPFRQQINFFRGKVRIGTRSWTDLWEGMHARGFVIAGATKDALLVDFQDAIAKAIEQGTTLQEFRRDFDEIVQKHGWAYKGGRNWRTRVIYETNLNTSYQAGRYAQMKEVTKTRPWWTYRHSDAVIQPRPEHQRLDGLTLRHDDPFWSTHYPPNGWGCQCYIETHNDRDLDRMGKSGPDTAPEIEYEEKIVGARGPSPRLVRTPKGIDPGWGYNIGEAAWGRDLSADVMQQWQDTADAWQTLTPGNALLRSRPERIPLDKPLASVVAPAKTVADTETMLRDILGGEEKIYQHSNLNFLINAKSLAKHMSDDLARTAYLPLLPETMNDPYETWLAFEQHQGSGVVRLRSRLIKAFDLGTGKGVVVVANATRGFLEGWTFVPVSNLNYLEKQRRGVLIYGR